MEDLDIRYGRAMDTPALRSWFAQDSVSRWLPFTTDKEQEEEAAYWMFFCKYHAVLTATIEHAPCGIASLLLMPYKKISHHAPFRLCVDPAKWGQGIGTALLRNMKHLAKDYFHLEAIYIEIYGDNPMTALLVKQGFRVLLQQEGYFRKEDKDYPRVCWIYEFQEGEKG